MDPHLTSAQAALTAVASDGLAPETLSRDELQPANGCCTVVHGRDLEAALTPFAPERPELARVVAAWVGFHQALVFHFEDEGQLARNLPATVATASRRAYRLALVHVKN